MTSGQVTWRELLSQPDAWRQLLTRLEAGELALPFDINGFSEIVLFGSGSSYYLALTAADWMRRRGLPARAIPSCEILLDAAESTPRADGLAIGFSRSGRSSEVLLAAEQFKRAGFTVSAISCTENSAQLKAADHPIHVAEGHEDGLVMLRSFTSMLLTLQWLTGNAVDHAALHGLPDAGQQLIDRYERSLADFSHARDFDRFVFLGSGPDYPLAMEASLKIQEMSIATSEAYHSLEYRHGPKACADSRTMICIQSLPDRDLGLSLARDMASLGAAVMVVGTDATAYGNIAGMTVPLPRGMTAAQASVLSMLTLQLFAYATATRLGSNPDAPQNLSKVVTF